MIVIKAKKIILLTVLTIFLACFCGCDNELLHKEKPFNFYYTNLLAGSFVKEKVIKVSLIDTVYYKNYSLNNSEISVLKNFLIHLEKHNYINRPSNLPSKPMYRFFLTFSKTKFVLDVYNKNYVTISPWDGYYSKDFLDITDIPSSCNPYNFSIHAIPR